MKKSALLGLSMTGIIVLLVSIYSRQIGLCQNLSYSSCRIFFDGFAEVLFPSIPLFLFSLVTYFLSGAVFKAWSRFALVWIPLSMIVIAIVPEYAGDVLYSYGKGLIAFYSSILFSIISIVIITASWFKAKKIG